MPTSNQRGRGANRIRKLLGLGLICVFLLALLAAFGPRQDTHYDGKSAREWVNALRGDFSTARAALLRIGPPAIPALVAATQREYTDLERFQRIARLKAPDRLKPLIPTVVRYHEMGNVNMILADLRPVRQTVLRALRRNAEAGEEAQRFCVQWALRRLPAEFFPEMLPVAIRGLDDEFPSVREQAALTLAAFGPIAAEAEPRLIELLTPARGARYEFAAAQALGALGVASPEVLEVLQSLFDAEDAKLRAHAIHAHYRLSSGLESAIQEFRRFLRDGQELTTGLRLVAEIGEDAADLASDVRGFLNDDDDRIRTRAAHCLWRLTGDTQSAIPTLCAAAESERGPSRNSAVSILAEIGVRTPEVREALLAALRTDTWAETKIKAITFLQTFDSLDPETLERLIQLSKSPHPDLRDGAMEALDDTR